MKQNKMTEWVRCKQTFPFGDQNVTVSLIKREGAADVYQLQVSFEHGEMSKWELFKRLLFRLTHKEK